jgi:hypothetical protein
MKCDNIPTYIGDSDRPKGDLFNEDDYVNLFAKVKSK